MGSMNFGRGCRTGTLHRDCFSTVCCINLIEMGGAAERLSYSSICMNITQGRAGGLTASVCAVILPHNERPGKIVSGPGSAYYLHPARLSIMHNACQEVVRYEF